MIKSLRKEMLRDVVAERKERRQKIFTGIKKIGKVCSNAFAFVLSATVLTVSLIAIACSSGGRVDNGKCELDELNNLRPIARIVNPSTNERVITPVFQVGNVGDNKYILRNPELRLEGTPSCSSGEDNACYPDSTSVTAFFMPENSATITEDFAQVSHVKAKVEGDPRCNFSYRRGCIDTNATVKVGVFDNRPMYSFTTLSADHIDNDTGNRSPDELTYTPFAGSNVSMTLDRTNIGWMLEDTNAYDLRARTSYRATQKIYLQGKSSVKAGAVKSLDNNLAYRMEFQGETGLPYYSGGDGSHSIDETARHGLVLTSAGTDYLLMKMNPPENVPEGETVEGGSIEMIWNYPEATRFTTRIDQRISLGGMDLELESVRIVDAERSIHEATFSVRQDYITTHVTAEEGIPVEFSNRWGERFTIYVISAVPDPITGDMLVEFVAGGEYNKKSFVNGRETIHGKEKLLWTRKNGEVGLKAVEIIKENNAVLNPDELIGFIGSKEFYFGGVLLREGDYTNFTVSYIPKFSKELKVATTPSCTDFETVSRNLMGVAAHGNVFSVEGTSSSLNGFFVYIKNNEPHVLVPTVEGCYTDLGNAQIFYNPGDGAVPVTLTYGENVFSMNIAENAGNSQEVSWTIDIALGTGNINVFHNELDGTSTLAGLTPWYNERLSYLDNLTEGDGQDIPSEVKFKIAKRVGRLLYEFDDDYRGFSHNIITLNNGERGPFIAGFELVPHVEGNATLVDTQTCVPNPSVTFEFRYYGAEYGEGQPPVTSMNTGELREGDYSRILDRNITVYVVEIKVDSSPSDRVATCVPDDSRMNADIEVNGLSAGPSIKVLVANPDGTYEAKDVTATVEGNIMCIRYDSSCAVDVASVLGIRPILNPFNETEMTSTVYYPNATAEATVTGNFTCRYSD